MSTKSFSPYCFELSHILILAYDFSHSDHTLLSTQHNDLMEIPLLSSDIPALREAPSDCPHLLCKAQANTGFFNNHDCRSSQLIKTIQVKDVMFRRVNVTNLLWEEKMINCAVFAALGMLIGDLKLIFLMSVFLGKIKWVEKEAEKSRYVLTEELGREWYVGWKDERERIWS